MLIAEAGIFSTLFFLACLLLNPACAATGVFAHVVAVPENSATIPNTHAQ